MALERARTATMRHVESTPQRLAAFGSLPRATQGSTQVDQSTSELQEERRSLKRGDGLAQELQAGGTTFDETDRSERDAQRSRRAELPCEIDLFLSKSLGLRCVAELKRRERGQRAPGADRRVGH